MQIIFSPHVSLERYAEMVGVSLDVARTWQRNRKIPTFKQGKRVMVDLTQFVDFSKLRFLNEK